jgi:predicted nucleic acid-binding protein
MKVFIDTSAFLAVLAADDFNHDKAKSIWLQLLSNKTDLVCTSYVLVETYALVQSRLGLEALRVFHEDIFPLLEVIWINERFHENGANAVLTSNRRQLSLVDCVSFAVMRSTGINTVFTFDRHFREQGFECLGIDTKKISN